MNNKIDYSKEDYLSKSKQILASDANCFVEPTKIEILLKALFAIGFTLGGTASNVDFNPIYTYVYVFLWLAIIPVGFLYRHRSVEARHQRALEQFPTWDENIKIIRSFPKPVLVELQDSARFSKNRIGLLKDIVSFSIWTTLFVPVLLVLPQVNIAFDSRGWLGGVLILSSSVAGVVYQFIQRHLKRWDDTLFQVDMALKHHLAG